MNFHEIILYKNVKTAKYTDEQLGAQSLTWLSASFQFQTICLLLKMHTYNANEWHVTSLTHVRHQCVTSPRGLNDWDTKPASDSEDEQ